MAAEQGWYPDPQGPGRRWWDGTVWTEYTDDVDGPAFGAPMPTTPTSVHPVIAPVRPAPGPVEQPSSGRYAVAPSAYPAPTAPPVGVWRGPMDDRPPVANLGDAVRVVLAKYAQFAGRAGRAAFWYWQLFLAICYVGALAMLFIPIVGFVAALALVVGALGVIVPNYAVAVRRLRDAGFHGAWILLGLVPFGSLALIVMWCQPSKYA